MTQNIKDFKVVVENTTNNKEGYMILESAKYNIDNYTMTLNFNEGYEEFDVYIDDELPNAIDILSAKNIKIELVNEC